MSTLKLYRYNEDFGRMGSLDSVFLANDEDIQKIKGKDLYFGEVLGKHSEIIGTIDDSTLTLLSDNDTLVSILLDIFPDEHISGMYIFDYDVEGEEDDS